MTKIDEEHPDFVGKVLCSRGIGAGYTRRPDAAKHKYKKGETIETYRLRNGTKINLPIYYRNITLELAARGDIVSRDEYE